MLTLSWKKAGATSSLALLLAAGLPSLAQAQLFPNLWIQRERAACANEPPFYGHVRRDYYGYYPTCWRKFPEGWACPTPNPEAPNAAAEFVKQPRDDRSSLITEDEIRGERERGRRNDPDTLDPSRDPGDLGLDPLPGRGDRTRPTPGAAPTGTGPRRPGPDGVGVPPLPSGNRAPFNLDSERPSGIDAKRPAVPTPLDDPFATDPPSPTRREPNSARPAAPGSRPGPLAPPGTGVLPLPDGPALDRPKSASHRPAPEESSDPVLALPEMTPPSSSLPESPSVAASMPPSLPTNGSFLDSPFPADTTRSEAKTEPTLAPRRPSLIGGFFNQMSRRRR